MGDIANGYDCNVFIVAFSDAIVQKFRSPFLDLMFEDRVRYYVAADDNWEVHLYAAIQTGRKNGSEEEEEHLRIESCPVFYPTSDDINTTAAEELDLEEEEVRRRMAAAIEELEKEEEALASRGPSVLHPEVLN